MPFDPDILERYRLKLRYKVCYHLGSFCPDVDDVVQETFTRFLRILQDQKIRNPESTGALLNGICNHVIQEYRRGIWKEPVVDPETVPRDRPAPPVPDMLELTGTHVGCETGLCGACTVHLDGEAVKSCLVLAVQAHGSRITTVEGLASDGDLDEVQRGFWEEQGLQCGYCTPGILLAAHDLLARSPNPTEADVRSALSGNLCRCTGYQTIVAAVRSAARKMRQKKEVRMPAAPSLKPPRAKKAAAKPSRSSVAGVVP